MISLFVCTICCNAVLQKHYRTLEALALEHEEVEEVDDLTIPDDARIRKRVGSAIEAFKLAVFPAGYEAGAKRTKRKVRALEFFYSAYQSLFF